MNFRTKLVILKGVLSKKSPIYVQFAVTKFYNLSCKMCNEVKARKDEKKLSLSEIENQKILDNIQKQTNLEVIERVIKYSNQEGLITQGFFIFGLPGETKQSIEETIKFAKRTLLDRAQFLLLDILPGSALWNELDGASIADWKKRSYQEVTWVPSTINKKFLEQAPAYAFKSFFFRPRQLFRLVKFIKPYQIPFIVRRLKDFRIVADKRNYFSNS